MAVSDWSTTAASNTTVGPVNIAEGCPAANMNNMGREIMAQIASWRDGLPAQFQPSDATLTGLAGLTTASNQVPYATGVNTFAMTVLTAYGRTLISAPDADAANAVLGTVRVTAFNLGIPGFLRFSFGANTFQIAWGTFTAAANLHTNVNYHTPFNGFSIAVVSGCGEASAIAQDNNPAVTTTSATGFGVFNASGSAPCFYVAVGV